MSYIERDITDKLSLYLMHFPVVGITGPRGGGKTTLLRHLLKSGYTYLSFDHYTTVQFFYDDPEKFIQTYGSRVIFDEVQRIPELFPLIKSHVDENREIYGNFILIGSSQFSLLDRISESLAGRIGLLTLLPFQYTEIPGAERLKSQYKGGFPELIMRAYTYADAWFDSYIETYLEKDVRFIHAVENIRDFRRCIALLAANATQLLNMSSIAKEIGVTVATVKKWISILEASYLIFLLPPYYTNRNKRIVKSPKVYFYDSGLLTHLLGLSSEEGLGRSVMSGPLFENYIVSEVQKAVINTSQRDPLFFYKEMQGKEVDLIIKKGERRHLVAIKSSATFRTSMLANMKALLEEGDRGTLVYQGDSMPYAGPVDIAHFSTFLETLQSDDFGKPTTAS